MKCVTPGLANISTVILTGALILFSILMILCLIRAIIGPRIADRIVAINMMSTMILVIIGILTILLQEGYLGDICLIYAMISFLSVIVLSKVYIGIYAKKKLSQEQADASEKEGGHNA